MPACPFGAASNGAPTLTGKWIIGDAAGHNAQIVAVNAQAAVNPGLSFTTGDVTVNTGSQLFFEPRLSTYGATSGTQNLTVSGQGPIIPNAVGNDVADGAIKLLGDAKVNLTSNVNTNVCQPRAAAVAVGVFGSTHSIDLQWSRQWVLSR